MVPRLEWRTGHAAYNDCNSWYDLSCTGLDICPGPDDVWICTTCSDILTIMHTSNCCFAAIMAGQVSACSASAEAAMHVTISEGTPMLLQPVLQGSPSLPNVHLWAFCAGNGVDHSLSLIHWHSVLRVNQELAKGHQRA